MNSSHKSARRAAAARRKNSLILYVDDVLRGNPLRNITPVQKKLPLHR